MSIPFANTVLWWITRGGENQGMMDVLRMKPSPRSGLVPANPGDASHSIGDFEGLAANHVYVLPVRESYGLRMQSNFLNRDGFRLPDRNACTISWKKSSP
jgi:hypothetical protein